MPGLRPWNRFLVATAIGRKPSEDLERAIAVAPFERDPDKWVGLDWRFAESGEPIPFDKPDSKGFEWRLRTLRKFLSSYARHPIPEMLASDGSRCGPFTRGVLRRRQIRDGERWLILKEAAVWGYDDPRHAFSVPEPEKVRAGRSAANADWNIKIRPALTTVGPVDAIQVRKCRNLDAHDRAAHPESALILTAGRKKRTLLLLGRATKWRSIQPRK